MEDKERRNQIISQHRAAAALARSLADLYEEKAWFINTGACDDLAKTHGSDSLQAMEEIADRLNNMDAVDTDLAQRLDPIFRAGQKMFSKRHKADGAS